MPEVAIETKGLTKKYGDMFAIRDIDLALNQGDLFGFIGPNVVPPKVEGGQLRRWKNGC